MTKLNGRVYAIPQFWFTYAMAYSVTLFDELGIAPPPDNWTWDDLAEIGSRMSRDLDGDGANDTWGLGISGGAANRFRHWLQAAGGDLFSDDFTRVTVDSPESVRAMEFMYDLSANRGIVPDWNMGTGPTWNLFNERRVGMIPSGSADAVNRPGEGLVAEVTHMPYGPARRAAPLILEWVGVHAGTAHPDVAYDFAKFLVSEEALRAAIATFPTHTLDAGHANHNISVERFYGRNEPPRNLHVFIEAIEYAREPNQAPAGFEGAPSAMLRGSLLRALSGDITIQQAVEDIKRLLEAGMRR